MFIFSLVMMFTAGLVEASEMGVIVNAVEEVNSLRETNVEAVSGEIDKHLFKATCGPVGKKAKQIAKENNLIFRQVSHKNRNPKNKANRLEGRAAKRFKRDKNLKAFWLSLDGRDHYFRRINIQAQCLSCHGAKKARPEFIKRKYREDRAFGFKVGELRGLYHVYKK